MNSRLVALCVALLIASTSFSALARERRVVDYTEGATADAATLEIEVEKKGRFALSIPQVMRLYAIDDVPLKDLDTVAKVFGTSLGQKVDEVQLPAGKHRILLHATGKIGCGWAYLWFVAEPNQRYAAKFEFDRLLSRVWIEDVATGERVGGMAGSNDEPEPNEPSQEMYEATLAKCYV